MNHAFAPNPQPAPADESRGMSSIPPKGASTYFKTKVMTASPGELRQMLLDGAIRFAESARAGLERRDFEVAYVGVTRCQAILMELINGLRPEHDAELCRRLAALYTYMYTRLMKASNEKDATIVDEVLDLLRYERETWEMVQAKLIEENAAAAGMQATPSVAPPVDPTLQPRPNGLVGANVSLRG